MGRDKLERGSEVTVVAYGGERIRKRVWEDTGRSVLLCSDTGYQRAVETGQEPLYAGHPREAVVHASSTGESDGGT